MHGLRMLLCVWEGGGGGGSKCVRVCVCVRDVCIYRYCLIGDNRKLHYLRFCFLFCF